MMLHGSQYYEWPSILLCAQALQKMFYVSPETHCPCYLAHVSYATGASRDSNSHSWRAGHHWTMLRHAWRHATTHVATTAWLSRFGSPNCTPFGITQFWHLMFNGAIFTVKEAVVVKECIPPRGRSWGERVETRRALISANCTCCVHSIQAPTMKCLYLNCCNLCKEKLWRFLWCLACYRYQK